MPNAKGVSLIDMVKFLRAKRADAEGLLPQELRHYLDERINVAQWYPEEDMIGMVRVLAELMPPGSESALRMIGRINARAHIAGAYAHLFEDASPRALPLRARTLWKAMHDTGDLSVVVGEGEADVEITGYAHPSAEMCEMIQPYLEELFHASGLAKVDVCKRTCVLTGGSACRYYASWDPDEEPSRPGGAD